MTKSMTGPHFVDSNILVYRHDRDAPEKSARAGRILEHLWRVRSGRLSEQVLHEFYVVSTRKLARPVPREVARRDIRLLERWDPVPLGPGVREEAWRLEDRHGISWWDALIVSAAHAAGCPILLSEDLGDGRDYDGVRVLDPFARPYAELGLPDLD